MERKARSLGALDDDILPVVKEPSEFGGNVSRKGAELGYVNGTPNPRGPKYLLSNRGSGTSQGRPDAVEELLMSLAIPIRILDYRRPIIDTKPIGTDVHALDLVKEDVQIELHTGRHEQFACWVDSAARQLTQQGTA
jgi:hypothetical protein